MRGRLELIQSLLHRIAKTERRRGRVLVHKVISELPDEVSFGARKKLNLHEPDFRAWCEPIDGNDAFWNRLPWRRFAFAPESSPQNIP
jgi:hypothetical protein